MCDGPVTRPYTAAMDPARILTALADLAPVNKTAAAADFDEIGQKSAWAGSLTTVPGAADLAAHDELHRDERLLRQGWGIVTGVHRVDGKRRRLAVPLVTRPVRLEVAQTEPFDHKIVPAGDLVFHPKLVGTPYAARLAAVLAPERTGGDLADPAWLLAAATAAGYAVNAVTHRPDTQGSQPVVLARSVVYIAGPRTESGPIGQSLHDWAERPNLDATALAAMYGAADAPAPGDGEIRSALPLNREQAAAVRSARTAPVTVVAGAPGCGKSHTLAAIAVDAVARGQSVLIATQSVFAADVLAGILARRPGPEPLMFGDTERNGFRVPEPLPAKHRDDLRREAADAFDLLGRVERAIETRLDLERRRLRALDAPVFLLDDFPGLRDADLDAVEAAAAASRGEGGWPWTRWRRRKAKRELLRLAGTETDSTALQRSLDIARDVQAMTRLAAEGGPRLEPLWRNLDQADEAAAKGVGAALLADAGGPDRLTRKAARALSELSAARFRGDRAQRRGILEHVDTDALLRARPLWIGTVADAEAVLPARAGAFDLVIIDEASHVNQLRAAPVLARARRAVIAGDPRQLKFVSFASDARLHDVLERHGLQAIEARLDTGRVSLYDLACGAGPVVELTEHHRSVPHLIGFSSAKFYGGRVRPITAHPRVQQTDAITVHRVEAPAADEQGVLAAEVEGALSLLTGLVANGERGLAVLSPFRAQAEAIEAAVMKRFDLEAIRAHRIRTGTVHAFQGSESETVIASLGVAPGDPAGRKRFLAGANLFNVMVTRAREHLHVVTALGDPGGLVGEFLDYADRAPAAIPGDGAEGDWCVKLADALSGADAAVRHGYPVGHWKIDLVVGEGDAAFGVVCAVHPDGTRAHLDRHRALRRAGWRLVDAFPSTYADDASRAAVAVLAELKLGNEDAVLAQVVLERRADLDHQHHLAEARERARPLDPLLDLAGAPLGHPRQRRQDVQGRVVDVDQAAVVELARQVRAPDREALGQHRVRLGGAPGLVAQFPCPVEDLGVRQLRHRDLRARPRGEHQGADHQQLRGPADRGEEPRRVDEEVAPQRGLVRERAHDQARGRQQRRMHDERGQHEVVAAPRQRDGQHDRGRVPAGEDRREGPQVGGGAADAVRGQLLLLIGGKGVGTGGGHRGGLPGEVEGCGGHPGPVWGGADQARSSRSASMVSASAWPSAAAISWTSPARRRCASGPLPTAASMSISTRRERRTGRARSPMRRLWRSMTLESPARALAALPRAARHWAARTWQCRASAGSGVSKSFARDRKTLRAVV
jgi:hypothetical protein